MVCAWIISSVSAWPSCTSVSGRGIQTHFSHLRPHANQLLTHPHTWLKHNLITWEFSKPYLTNFFVKISDCSVSCEVPPDMHTREYSRTSSNVARLVTGKNECVSSGELKERLHLFILSRCPHTLGINIQDLEEMCSVSAPWPSHSQWQLPVGLPA